MVGDGAGGPAQTDIIRGGICQWARCGRRALIGLATAAAVLILPAIRVWPLGETLTVTPANTQAGGGTSATATLGFASGDTPKTVVTSLCRRACWAIVNANAACLAAQQLTAACQIGNGDREHQHGQRREQSACISSRRRAPTQPAIEFVPAAGAPAGADQLKYIGVSANLNAPGGLNLTTTFPNPTPAQITGFTANFTTLNGQPFHAAAEQL